MAVLNQNWQPSAEALQPMLPARTNGQDSRQPRLWSLNIWSAHLQRQCLSLLPKGLANLNLQ
jgi:hypothetical protein